MGIYAIGVFPKKTKNLGFANDFKGSGKLQELWSQWYSIVSYGLSIGYYPKASKTWLTVRAQYFDNTIMVILTRYWCKYYNEK